MPKAAGTALPRAAGILLHPTCLPGPFGVGDVGPAAERFVEWLALAGQTYWQILPLGPVGHSGSPYGSFSAFAGNPLLISPERLRARGLLEDIPPIHTNMERVDFPTIHSYKASLLRSAWERQRSGMASELLLRFEEFYSDGDVCEWLDDWTLFAALKERFPGKAWHQWPLPIRRREADALAAARRQLESEIDFHRFVQFIFFDQWAQLRRSMQNRGVRILGDLAIYLAPDSADVWANQQMFDLDSDGLPRAVAGVPPDYFSATGQLWGNPLYRWDRLAESGFDWWIKRLRWNLRQADLVRLDHFRGFAAFWEVPAAEKTAVNGRWRLGPGLDFFTAVEAALGELPLVAEDLGVITDDVTALRKAAGLPGMRVLQFAFSEPSSVHRPHCVPRDTVFYTGTHDNDTTLGWFESAGEEERQRVRDYVGQSEDGISWDLIRVAFTSAADTAIAPLQDLLGLGAEARLNTPAKASGQWTWRLSNLPDEQIARKLRRLTAVADRIPRSKTAENPTGDLS